MLYEKYRPQKFEDVLGQGETTRILQQQIVTGNVAHTYLLEGNRGSGKTTSARILAKALNCKNPQNGNPCGCCESCKGIEKGSNLDVIEIDAASNNGVDTVRDIISNMQYAPDGKYKVYIIDEAHMLSKSAFNAFLKTLEEPPKYGVFILCTTEKSNLPITIISRCQQYKFKNIEPLVIENHLKTIANAEQFQSQELDKISNLIAIKADGAMRDALCLLEQCMNSNLSYASLVNLIGFTGDSEVKNLALQALYGKSIETLFKMGDIDCITIVEGLVKVFRDIIIFRIAGPTVIKASTDELKLIERLSKAYTLVPNEKINEIITLLSLRYNDILNSKFKFTLLEMTMLSIEEILKHKGQQSNNQSETTWEDDCKDEIDPTVNEVEESTVNNMENNNEVEEATNVDDSQENNINGPKQDTNNEQPDSLVTISMIAKAKDKMISMLEGANQPKFDELISELRESQFLKIAGNNSILILGDKTDAIKASFTNPKMVQAMNGFFVFEEKEYPLILE